MPMAEEFFQQVRRIEAGGIDVQARGEDDDLEMEIEVTHNEDDGLTAEATLWNVARSSWESVEEGDPIRIWLGYRDGPENVVLIGEVEEKDPPERDTNTAYRLRARDESEKRLRGIYETKTWVDQDLNLIVRDIFNLAGIQPGEIDVPGGTVDGHWSISSDHNLKKALNKVVDEAEAMADVEHEWYCLAGEGHFLPKSRDIGRQIGTLEADQNLIKADESDGKDDKTDGGTELEIEALLDPRIEKDALAPIQTENHNGVYRVSEYSLTSSTDNGDHTMDATLVPTDAEFERDRSEKGGGAKATHI